MTIAVGDLVVVNGLPGTVLAIQTVGTATTYQVSLSNPGCRWLPASQLTTAGPIVVGAAVLLGSQPAVVLRVWPGGPYPLYLIEVDQTVVQWFGPNQINPALPPPPAAPAALQPAARPIPGRP